MKTMPRSPLEKGTGKHMSAPGVTGLGFFMWTNGGSVTRYSVNPINTIRLFLKHALPRSTDQESFNFSLR